MNRYQQLIAFSSLLVMLVFGMPAHAATAELAFNLPKGFGELKSTTIGLSAPGCIVVSVDSWSAQPGSAKAKNIALILNGPDKVEAYTRVDGAPTEATPLWMSFAVPHAGQWKVTVANFDKTGSATGVARIVYPPTSIPCEFRPVARRDGSVGIKWKSATGVIVERASGSRWVALPGCGETNCVDRSTIRGNSYLYRACVAMGESACSDSETTTPPRLVAVP